jgi:hypothetical protein
MPARGLAAAVVTPPVLSILDAKTMTDKRPAPGVERYDALEASSAQLHKLDELPP